MVEVASRVAPNTISAPAIDNNARVAAALLSGVGLFIVTLTLQPFAGPPEVVQPDAASGNVVNQLGYAGLAIVYLVAIMRLSERSVLAQLRSSSMIWVLAVAALSAWQAPAPDASLRALFLTTLGMVVVVGILLLSRSERDFAGAAGNATLAILVIVYAVLLFAPQYAVHNSEGVEGVHAGDWRGHLSHKNYAAPVFSMLIFIGIYCWRSGIRWRGIAIIGLGAIFVLNSGSKTTIGFLPLAVGLVLFGRAMSSPRLMLAAHGALVLLIAVLTVGSVMSADVLRLTTALISDPTFTGRDEIWRFSLAHIDRAPWLGHGLFGFWQTPAVTALEENFEASWDVRGIGSAHSTYLDAMIAFGVPGAAIVIYCLMIKPMIDYVRASADVSRRNMSDLFAMIVIFMTYVGMLESFILNRADPLWLLFAFGVFGLEFVGRMRVR